VGGWQLASGRHGAERGRRAVAADELAAVTTAEPGLWCRRSWSGRC